MSTIPILLGHWEPSEILEVCIECVKPQLDNDQMPYIDRLQCAGSWEGA